MKLFSSANKNSTYLNNTLNTLKGLGHTPMLDWVAILLIGVCAFIGIIIFTMTHYLSTIGFIKNLPAQQSNTEAAQIKTKEEKLRDIIELYTNRQNMHNSLLENSELIITNDSKGENAASAATSTKDQANVQSTNL
jgi:predicted PurR-regulated permease PerM